MQEKYKGFTVQCSRSDGHAFVELQKSVHPDALIRVDI